MNRDSTALRSVSLDTNTSKRSSKKSKLFASMVVRAAVVGVSVLGQSGYGATRTWDGGDANGANGANGGSGTWEVNTATLNWYPGTGTVDVSWTDTTGVDTAVLGGTAGTISLGTNVGVKQINLLTSGYTINGGANTMTLNAGISGLGLTSGTTTISGPILFNAAQTWANSGGSTITVGGPITESTASNFTKAGAGTVNFTGAATYTGTTSVNGGKLDLGTGGSITFTGSATGTQTTALGISNGEFAMTGSGGGTRSQSFGATTVSNGWNAITLARADSTQVTFTAASIARSIYAGGVFRGDNLGATPGAGTSNIIFTTAPTASATVSGATVYASLAGSDANGSNTKAVFHGFLYDGSSTGTGSGFATYEAGKGVRLLNSATEQTTTSAANVNFRVNAAATIGSANTLNTMQIDNSTGSGFTVTLSGTTTTQNGVLFSGNQPITATGGTFGYNVGSLGGDAIYLSTNTAGVTINSAFAITGATLERGNTFGGPGNFVINGALAGQGSNGAVSILGPGTVTLNSAVTTSSNGISVFGGTAKIGSSFSMSTSRPWRLAGGGTIDLNGTNVSNVEAFADLNGSPGVITNTGALATLTVSKGSNQNSPKSASVLLTGAMNLAVNMSVASTISGTHTGLLAPASYTGSTTISNGGLLIGTNNVLPTGTALTVTGGATVPSYFNLNGFNQQVASLAGSPTAGDGIFNGGGTASLSTLTINGSATTTYSGLIKNTGTVGTVAGTGGTVALAMAGSGVQTLSGANTYSGGTTISSGTLIASGASPLGSGAVTVNGGTLGGSGTVAAVTANSTGHVSPGPVQTIGTLSTAGITFNTGSVLDLDLSAGSNDVINSSNGLLVNATTGFNLFQAGTASPYSVNGTFTIFNITGGSIPTAGDLNSNFSILNGVGGGTYTWGVSGTNVTLQISGLAVLAQWNNTVAGSWGTAPNWTPSTPNAANDSATFGTVLTTSGTVTLDGNRTVGAVTFNNSSASYTLASGTPSTSSLTIQSSGTGSITNSNGNHAINVPVVLNSNTTMSTSNVSDVLTINGDISGAGNVSLAGGAGTIVFTGTNSYGTTSIAASNTLQIGNGGTTGTLGGGAVTVNGTLKHYRSDAVTISNAITGSGAYQQLAGTVTLTGTNSGTWSTNVAASTVLNIGNGGTTGAIGTGAVTLDGTINVNRSNASTIGGAITGAGTLNILGGGTATLNTTSSAFTGPVNVTGSGIQLGANDAAGVGLISGGGIVNRLTFSGTSSLSKVASAVTTTIPINVGIAGDVTNIDSFGSTQLTLNGNISGAGTVNRNAGTGQLSLGGSTSLTSPTALVGNAGFTGIFNNTSGNLTFTKKDAGSGAAQWNFTSSGTVTISNPGGTVVFGSLSGSQNISLTGGTGRLRVGDLGLSSTYSGNIVGSGTVPVGVTTSGGAGSLLKNGSGTLTISGQNSNWNAEAITSLFGYRSVISAGTLVAASSSTGTTSGPLSQSDPAQPTLGVALLGNATSAGTGPANTATLANATLSLAGGVTLANPITVSAGTNWQFNISDPVPTPQDPNTYTLTMGGKDDANSTFSGVINLMNNVTIAQAATTGSNKLTISGTMHGTQAEFGPSGIGTSVNNTGTQTVTFAGPGAIKMTGNILDGGGVAIIDANNTSFSTGTGVVAVKTTGGAIELSGANTYSGSTTVNGGTLKISGSYAAATPGSDTATVAAAGALNVAGTATFKSVASPSSSVAIGGTLNVNGSGASTMKSFNGTGTLNLTNGSLTLSDQSPTPITYASDIGTLSISGSAVLDIKNNAVQIRSTDTTDAARDARWAQVLTGQNNFDNNGQVTWDGPGIVSSTARTNNVGLGVDAFVVGVVSNHDLAKLSFDGGAAIPYDAGNPWLGTVSGVGADDILVRMTYAGDTNLDGTITIDDYNNIDGTFSGLLPTNYGWVSGDFDFSGAITIDDYNAIDTGFLYQGGQLTQGMIAARTAMFGADYVAHLEAVAAAFASVPEPTTAGVLAVGAMGLLARRRRKA